MSIYQLMQLTIVYKYFSTIKNNIDHGFVTTEGFVSFHYLRWMWKGFNLGNWNDRVDSLFDEEYWYLHE